ncbi:MAG: right-handed parallel beta-helix repeat-containing protein [Deltaproteobacteria bacterium]|jgi:hypothetical protein|nr:right-handed parallel beta-helix repeat-containing protein [Deltaproteobacteria bacterium]
MPIHVAALLMFLLAAPALAVDGVLEINQTCAVETGCFPGDAPGFPVSVTQPGSYRLTGSLDLSAEGVNVSGIAVDVPAATIDLGGFHIVGPTSCSGSGTTIDCNPSSTGVGSAGVQFSIDATAGVVQNGIVRSMTNFGIFSQATGLRVQDVTAIHNGRDGIAGREGALIVNSVAVENGQDGIDVNTGSVVDGVTAVGNGNNGVLGQGSGGVVTRSSARNNGMHGYSLGLQYRFGRSNASTNNELANLCGDGICTERRRLYQTTSSHMGDTVLTACALGFRPASIAEVQHAGQFDYDTIRGRTEDPPFQFVPSTNAGWATYGATDASTTCNFFSTADPARSGFRVRIQPIPVAAFDSQAGFEPVQSATVDLAPCSVSVGVWCVEEIP